MSDATRQRLIEQALGLPKAHALAFAKTEPEWRACEELLDVLADPRNKKLRRAWGDVVRLSPDESDAVEDLQATLRRDS